MKKPIPKRNAGRLRKDSINKQDNALKEIITVPGHFGMEEMGAQTKHWSSSSSVWIKKSRGLHG
jgi:hypothetical protein